MTSEQRAALKQAVSDEQKRRWKAVRVAAGRCAGCGCPYLERTTGCVNCMHRAYDRRKKAEALLEWSRSL